MERLLSNTTYDNKRETEKTFQVSLEKGFESFFGHSTAPANIGGGTISL